MIEAMQEPYSPYRSDTYSVISVSFVLQVWLRATITDLSIVAEGHKNGTSVGIPEGSIHGSQLLNCWLQTLWSQAGRLELCLDLVPWYRV